MKKLIILLLILIGIGAQNENPWHNKTPAELEEIVDTVSLTAPTIL